jgi:plasmid stabilization system protein ParE
MPAVLFRPEAEAELAEAVEWYEARGRGLGSEFLRALDAVLASVLRNPMAYPVVFGRVRRAMFRRYPYTLLYELSDSGDAILVVACFHGARDPRRWQDRT